MSKRQSSYQGDRDTNYSEDEENDGPSEGWKVADPATIAARKIVKAKRSEPEQPTTTTETKPELKKPVFQLLPANLAPVVTATVQSPLKPLSILSNPGGLGGWSCKTCTTSNKATSINCAACNEPISAKSVQVARPVETVKPAETVPLQIGGGLKILSNLGNNSWLCKTCTTSNKESSTKCVACEAPKESLTNSFEKKVEEVKPVASGFLGTGFTPSLPATTSTGFSTSSFTTPSTGFTFNSVAPATGGFKFTTPVISDANSNTTTTAPVVTSSFGSFATTAAPVVTSSFGSFATSASASTTSSGFKMSLPDFGARANPFAAVVADTKKAENGEEESPEKFEPATLNSTSTSEYAKLAEAVQGRAGEGSGEEHDTILFKTRVKLYSVKTEASELGIGEVHINSFDATKYRIVLRQEKTNRLLLNVQLTNAVKQTCSIENTAVRFSTVGPEGSVLNYILRCKERADAKNLLNNIQKNAGLPITKED